ncbi:heavy metal translocating P-type ATPase [Pseudobacteroides cellulosolvens]|uniref:Heavy metal translocating P-type ATPase n=1 Tax=Pseudobacteroides cellulosolvens ATCC 35603 = DSM 2933 TaxID=398512 RepID=A0A0L6JU55_9FIRM|nr:heavy metal translocating P-type ATPase [Pseudobacteroides cellulosolvens]KNY29386.1 heavy metal translocating P-type ATPase [Pseudobacteroides cellulosolvens ATCC 35603 = DSM 2933]
MGVASEKILTNRKYIYFSGLHCADCAAKIENEVNRINGVKSASLDFVSQKLTIDAIDKNNLHDIVQQAAEIAVSIEPDIQIINNENTNENPNEARTLKTKKEWLKRTAFGLGALLFAVAVFIDFPFWAQLSLYVASYLLVGSEVVLRAFKNILKGRVFDENFLMSIATIGAFAIGEYPEGVAVMLFYQVGEFFQDAAVNRSRKSITALMDIRPDFANLKVGDELQRVSPEQVKIGDKIVVKAGEKIPLDGVVIDGRSTLDTSALTGESLLRNAVPGDEVLSGSINKNGLLTINVTKAFGESTVSKILDLVQNASSKKAVTENFITKFARYYTPFVVFAAAALAVIPPLVIPGSSFSEWINRALVFLVVSCPCALVVSIPLSFFGGIGGASKNGILIKGGNFLEALNNVDTIVFDKTGTLTKGVFNVTNITSKSSITESKILEYAALAESYSNHPIALSILKAYEKEVDKTKISNYEEVAGNGIRANIEGKNIVIGNTKLMAKENISFEEIDTFGTVIHMSIEGSYAGYIIISDEIKPDSKKALKELKSLGVKSLVMLTGDSKSAGEKIGNEIGMDQIYTELLPHEKVEKLEMLDIKKTTAGKLVFVGDGINDAPVLARADVGVAMGGLGSDAAIEAADIVLMTDEPLKLVSAVKIARRTRNIVWQNIIFAMAVKGIILLLGAGGIATMWEAVFGDVGVAVIAILNAMRVYK